MIKREQALPCVVLVGALCGSMIALGAASRGDVERGRYLVEQVAMCADCHTPRTPQGEPDRAKWLAGAKLDFQPIQPVPAWSGSAPAIAGLPGFSEPEAIKLLETGLAPDGKPPRPPMPPYRMSRVDAAAVVAYLRSLRSGGSAAAHR